MCLCVADKAKSQCPGRAQVVELLATEAPPLQRAGPSVSSEAERRLHARDRLSVRLPLARAPRVRSQHRLLCGLSARSARRPHRHRRGRAARRQSPHPHHYSRFAILDAQAAITIFSLSPFSLHRVSDYRK